MPPETIAGRYRVEREVGRGGMGSVWLCQDELLGRAVAVKQVGRLPGESAPDLQRALREARSSAPLNHRNVVSIYDAIEGDDHTWLVMEYVAGRTLTQILAEDGPMLPARVAWIGAQVADGLAAAHERGTVHRDVKPGNILVTDDDHAKISDFGISRTTGDPTLTASGFVSGTPGYFSPQLARGEEPAPSDDVWALGASLYTAVEGRPPYPEQPNAIAMLSAIAAGEPRPPERATFLTGPLERMLDSDPATRWSMAEVAHTLHRLHRTHDTSGTRASVAAPAPVPATAAAAIATTAMPSSPEPTPEPAPQPDPTPTATEPFDPVPPAPAPAPSSPREGGGRRGLFAVLAVLLLAALVGGVYLLANRGDDTPSARDTTPGTGRSHSTSPKAGSSSASSTPTDPGTTEPGTTAQSPTQQAPPAAGGGATGFVEDYYAVLPDDTRAGWAMLSPDYQAQTSYGDYAGFWSTIDAVSVDDAVPAPGGAVDVTLTYTSGGGTQSEVRRIWLERGGDGYLIASDAVR